MKKILLSTLLLFAVSGANATIITFDAGLDPLFTYNGITGFSVAPPGTGYEAMVNLTGSNNWVINSMDASPATFTWAGAGTFDLNSFAIAGAWGSQTLKIEGLFNNTVINTANFAVNNLNADIFSPNWVGINAFRIYTGTDYIADTSLALIGSGQYWALDNLTINEISEVPLPAAAFLFAPALLGFIGLRRKTKVTVA